MEGSIDPATSTLLCLENNDTCFDEFDCNVADESLSWDHKHLNLNNQCLIKDNHGSEHFWDFSVQSDETVMGLVGRESEHLPHVGYLKRLLSGDLDLSVRNEALDWIWKVGLLVLSNGGSWFCCLFHPLIDGEWLLSTKLFFSFHSTIVKNEFPFKIFLVNLLGFLPWWLSIK